MTGFLKKKVGLANLTLANRTFCQQKCQFLLAKMSVANVSVQFITQLCCLQTLHYFLRQTQLSPVHKCGLSPYLPDITTLANQKNQLTMPNKTECLKCMDFQIISDIILLLNKLSQSYKKISLFWQTYDIKKKKKIKANFVDVKICSKFLQILKD